MLWLVHNELHIPQWTWWCFSRLCLPKDTIALYSADKTTSPYKRWHIKAWTWRINLYSSTTMGKMRYISVSQSHFVKIWFICCSLHIRLLISRWGTVTCLQADHFTLRCVLSEAVTILNFAVSMYHSVRRRQYPKLMPTLFINRVLIIYW